MFRRIQLGATAVCVVFILAVVYLAPATAQNSETEIRARARVFPDIGPGLIGIKRDATGRYYVVASPASTVQMLSAEGKRIGDIPSAAVQDCLFLRRAGNIGGPCRILIRAAAAQSPGEVGQIAAAPRKGFWSAF